MFVKRNYIQNCSKKSMLIFIVSVKGCCVNDSSTCRLKANEESGDDETQSKDNQKSEKDTLVSKSYLFVY